MRMSGPATKKGLGGTGTAVRPGDYVLGSQQSRVAARSLLVARKADDDESSGNLDGLAERIRAERLRCQTGNMSASLPIEGGQRSNGGRSADCLSERIRKARERVRRALGPGDHALRLTAIASGC